MRSGCMDNLVIDWRKSWHVSFTLLAWMGAFNFFFPFLGFQQSNMITLHSGSASSFSKNIHVTLSLIIPIISFHRQGVAYAHSARALTSYHTLSIIWPSVLVTNSGLSSYAYVCMCNMYVDMWIGNCYFSIYLELLNLPSHVHHRD